MSLLQRCLQDYVNLSDSNSFRERLDRHQLVTLQPQPGLCALMLASRPSADLTPVGGKPVSARHVIRANPLLLCCLSSRVAAGELRVRQLACRNLSPTWTARSRANGTFDVISLASVSFGRILLWRACRYYVGVFNNDLYLQEPAQVEVTARWAAKGAAPLCPWDCTGQGKCLPDSTCRCNPGDGRTPAASETLSERICCRSRSPISGVHMTWHQRADCAVLRCYL